MLTRKRRTTQKSRSEGRRFQRLSQSRLRPSRRLSQSRLRPSLRLGGAYLDNVVTLRKKTNVSARRALALATTAKQNRNRLYAADEAYRATIDRAAQAILFPPVELHYGNYSRIVAPIRFEETRNIVHARLPTDTLRERMDQHAMDANRAATIAQRMAEQARRLRMHVPHQGDYETERRAALTTVEKINQQATALEQGIVAEHVNAMESVDQAFDLIRSLTTEDLSRYQFTLHTSTDTKNTYKGRRLKADVLVALPGKAPLPFELPPTLVRDHLDVLTMWVRVSQHLTKAMKTAQPPPMLQINQTKNRATVIAEFRVENLITTYKIIALIAWIVWKGREQVTTIRPGQTASREDIKKEVRALDAEVMFYAALHEWLQFLLQSRSNPIGKKKMEEQLDLLVKSETSTGWISLLKKHADKRRMDAKSATSSPPSKT